MENNTPLIKLFSRGIYGLLPAEVSEAELQYYKSLKCCLFLDCNTLSRSTDIYASNINTLQRPKHKCSIDTSNTINILCNMSDEQYKDLSAPDIHYANDNLLIRIDLNVWCRIIGFPIRRNRDYYILMQVLLTAGPSEALNLNTLCIKFSLSHTYIVKSSLKLSIMGIIHREVSDSGIRLSLVKEAHKNTLDIFGENMYERYLSNKIHYEEVYISYPLYGILGERDFVKRHGFTKTIGAILNKWKSLKSKKKRYSKNKSTSGGETLLTRFGNIKSINSDVMHNLISDIKDIIKNLYIQNLADEVEWLIHTKYSEYSDILLSINRRYNRNIKYTFIDGKLYCDILYTLSTGDSINKFYSGNGTAINNILRSIDLNSKNLDCVKINKRLFGVGNCINEDKDLRLKTTNFIYTHLLKGGSKELSILCKELKHKVSKYEIREHVKDEEYFIMHNINDYCIVSIK